MATNGAHVSYTGLSHALFTASRCVSTMSPPWGVSTVAFTTVCPTTGTTTVLNNQIPNIIDAKWVALKVAKRDAAPIISTMTVHTITLPRTTPQAAKTVPTEA